jgi:hypothetical protein
MILPSLTFNVIGLERGLLTDNMSHNCITISAQVSHGLCRLDPSLGNVPSFYAEVNGYTAISDYILQSK